LLILGAPAVVFGVEPVALGPAFEVHPERRTDDPVTGLFLEGFCCTPRMAGDLNGNVLVTWTGDPSQEGLFARKFDAGGAPTTSVLRLNGYVTEDQVHDAYASRGVAGADAKGNFIVAWVDLPETDYYGYRTRLVRLNPRGVETADKVLSSPLTTEKSAGMAVDDDGSFIVVWRDTEEYSILGRRGVNGNVKGGPVTLSSTPVEGSAEFGPEVAVDGLGRWMVAWEDSYANALRARVVDGTLASGDAELLIAGGAPPAQPAPGNVVPLDEGGFIVAWFDADSGGAYGRHVDATGNLGGQFPIGSPGAREVAAARVDTDRFVVVWYEYAPDRTVDVILQLHRNDGTLEGAPFVVDSQAEGGHWAYLAATSRGDGRFAVVWDGLTQGLATTCNSPTQCGLMSRWFALSEEPEDILLPGRTLVITNVVPDDPEKRRAQWLARDAALVGIAPGSLSDPRCLFDPPGTVKATLRVSSPTSGHDTGAISLPCQSWQAFGRSPQRSFRYRDTSFSHGPCSQIILKEGKFVQATCRRSFPYDLETGISEGSIDVVLTVGSKSYCSSFAATDGQDGSDARRFLGKDAPAAAACGLS
jgi:hypothetical protein